MSASNTSQVGHRGSLLWLHTKAQRKRLYYSTLWSNALIRARRLDNSFHDVSCRTSSLTWQSVGAPVGCHSERLLTGAQAIVPQAMEWHSFSVWLSKDWKRTGAKRFIISLKAMLKKKKAFVENQSINQRMPHLAMMLNLTLGLLILVDSEGKRKMGGYNRPMTTHWCAQHVKLSGSSTEQI